MTDSIASSESSGATDGDTDTAPTTIGCHHRILAAHEDTILTTVDADITSIPYVVKRPHANSKLILQNMEEVLNSVKKKHRQKHRRKKEQKKLAAQIAEAERVAMATTGTAIDIDDGNVQTPQEMATVSASQIKYIKAHAKRRQKKGVSIAQENAINATKAGMPKSDVERKSPLKGMSFVGASNTILKHFPPTPGKGGKPAVVDEEATQEVKSDAGNEVESAVIEVKKSGRARAANAFELMMNARNKTIGSNTPGKEAPLESLTASDTPNALYKVRRKLLLQEWADKRGGIKRRLEEEQRSDYAERQLLQRSKKFKQMLVNGTATRSTPISESQDNSNVLESNMDTPAAKVVRGRGRPRGCRQPPRRESLAESTPEAFDTSPLDAEAAEFLSNLSPSTKKRDSLLRFFLKADSPRDLAAKAKDIVVTSANKSETPKTRGRRSSTFKYSANSVGESNGTATAQAVNVNGTPSSRPRRSCAAKTRYDYDLCGNGKKESAYSIGTVEQDTKIAMADRSIDIINLDDSSGMPSKNLDVTPSRLAPLFTRSMPKPSVDLALLKARQEFLMSGVPNNLRREQAKQKQHEQSLDDVSEIFPKISHVQQLSAVELHVAPRQRPMRFKLLYPDEYPVSPIVTSSGGRRSKSNKGSSVGTRASCTAKGVHVPPISNKAAQLLVHYAPHAAFDKCALVKAWKADFERFPTYKCYNQMREKYRYFSAVDAGQNTEQVTESFVVTRRTRRWPHNTEGITAAVEEEVRPPVAAPNGELLFTEKYKPMMLAQVLVNLNPVTRLREFLGNWASGNSARSSQAFDDSTYSVNDSNSSPASSCNSVVLLGPISSGKTTAVFALANEMNFNVLEINAGMKRTGKKLIQELQEATQSHQIRKEPVAATGQTKAQQRLLKMSLNGLNSKKRGSKQMSVGSETPATPDTDVGGTTMTTGGLSQCDRKCLILIEDADVVFDQTDAGFTDAIYTLAASSKRPVIVVSAKPNCAHLQRLMQQNTITFAAPNSLNIAKFLAVLALMENCPIKYDDIISLYLFNRKDLRKTLLELQFFIQSGGDTDRHRSPDGHATPSKKEQQRSQFFASPDKRRFSEDPNAPVVVDADDQIATAAPFSLTASTGTEEVYQHRTLFEFYTMSQNQSQRLPFPVDFRLLGVNLNGLLHIARRLQPRDAPHSPATVFAKRKTRPLEKSALNSNVYAVTKAADTPLDVLCGFYEQLSVAALLGLAYDEDAGLRDRLVSHAAEDMVHELVERSISVHLDAPLSSYNLFHKATERSLVLSDCLGAVKWGSKRTSAVDYEPLLRSICRSEQQRATLERRSSRFYHYLRNSATNICNFSTKPFELACEILQELAEEGKTDDNPT